MADKPRLKDTDEILNSIVKGRKTPPPLPEPGSVPQDAGERPKRRRPPREQTPATEAASVPAAPAKEEPLISSPLNQRMPRRRGGARPERDEDPNPLDFGKYQLPRQKQERNPPPPGPDPDLQPRPLTEPPYGPDPESRPQPLPDPVPIPAMSDEGEKPRQVKKRPARRRADATQEQPVAPPAEKPVRRDGAAAGTPGSAGEQQVADPPAAAVISADDELMAKITEYQYEELGRPDEGPQPAPAPKRSRAARQAEPVGQPEKPVLDYTFPTLEELEEKEAEGRQVAVSQPVEEQDRQGDHAEAFTSLLPDQEVHRESFLKRLSSQFDQEFTQKFEESPAERKVAEDPSWFDAPPEKRNAQPPVLPEEEVAANQEADQFLRQFERKVRQEEESQAESFKETLAEKFARERERYLKELGINENEPPPGNREAEETAPPRQRKRLDLHIQPEMHRQPEEKKPMPPVTYGPGGVAKVQEDSGEELPYLPGADTPAPAAAAQAGSPQAETAEPEPAPGGKKTSEELLMELAVQKAFRGLGDAGKKQPPKKQPAQLRFSTPAGEGDRDKAPKKRWLRGRPSRITAAVSAVAALLVLALLAWPVTTWLRLQNQAAAPEEEPAVLTLPQDTETVREFRTPDKLTTYKNVMVKKAGITLSNLKITNHLVISDIETQGEILLKDVAVDGAIYVRASAIDLLKLDNVKASRIVVDNPDARVTVQARGGTTVGTLEVKTPATVQQQDLTGEGMGIENMLLKKSEGVGNLDVILGGLDLRSLTTIGDAVVALADGVNIETLSGEGNLSVSGNGRIITLSAGSPEPEGELSLSLKDISVSKLDLKSPAQVSLGGRVDVLTTASSLNMGGGGVVGSIMLNSGSQSSLRLPVDLSDVSVHNMTVNTDARVNAAGNAQVNTLTANHSVYMMGNKVNYLDVKASGVVYENEPDNIRTQSGVRPPQSVADNPNLDYELPVVGEESSLDASDDMFASTCGHARENGAFLVGDGSRANPYQVSTPAQLSHVGTHLSSHFVQVKDIDISDDSKFAAGFPLIGGDSGTFTGSYDGGGFRIVNLRISSSAESVGLFPQNTGEIRGVNIASGEVVASGSRSYVGGVVGLNFQGGLVESCSNGAKVIGGAGSSGGVVGFNSGAKVRDCYNYAKVIGQSAVGGIAGANGDNAQIARCYNVGTIDGTDTAGAIAGSNAGATIANCYYLADTAESGIGSGSGANNVVVKTSDEMSAPQMALDLAAGDDQSPWTMPGAGSYTYPVLTAPPTQAPPSSQAGG